MYTPFTKVASLSLLLAPVYRFAPPHLPPSSHLAPAGRPIASSMERLILPLLPGFGCLACRLSHGGSTASPGLLVGQSDFYGECLLLKSFPKAGYCCLNSSNGGWKAGYGRSRVFSSQEPGLIDVKEGSDGTVLFRFGTADVRDKMVGYIFPGEQSTKIMPPSGSTRLSRVLDCPATTSGKWEASEGLLGKQFVLRGKSCILNQAMLKDENEVVSLDSLASHTKSRQMRRNEATVCGYGRLGLVEEYRAFCDISERLYQDFVIESTPNYYDLNKQLGLPASFAKVHKLARASGCSTFRVYNIEQSALIGRDFVEAEDIKRNIFNAKWQYGPIDLPHSQAAMMMMTVHGLPEKLIEDKNIIEVAPTTVKDTATFSTTKRRQSEGVKRKSIPRPRKGGKSATQARDLFRRSRFQLYEIIFCYPFMNSNSAALNLQTITRDNLEDIVSVFNQIAVGLAGGGLALVLFVASRMLSINATLDSGKVASLIRGVGLIWLSSAVQKLGGVVRCMARACSKERHQRREQLAQLRRELQALTFKAFTFIALSVVRLA